MRNLSYSFTPSDTRFIFDIDSEVTIKRGLKSAHAARLEWIRLRGL